MLIGLVLVLAIFFLRGILFRACVSYESAGEKSLTTLSNDSLKLELNKILTKDMSLEEINSPIHVSLFRKVKSIFPNHSVSKNWKDRRKQIDKINDNNVPQIPGFDSEDFWEDLDTTYYGNYDSFYHAINNYVMKYKNKHNNAYL